MFEIIAKWIENAGMAGNWAVYISIGLSAVIVLLLAWLSIIIARKIIMKVLMAIIRKSQTKWDDYLLKHRVFERLSHLVPALVIYAFAGVFPEAEVFIQKLCMAYIIIAGLITVNSFLNAITDVYKTFKISKQRPIKGYIQVVQIFLYVISGIFVIATLMGKSPWYFISGLGALTAILILVFKDSILGLVSSIQLSTNDMIQIGDWIEMPKYGADGDVIDVSLNTVKVQNFDKTITTIPTYALMSDSFKNWRGMSESGGRRIKRAINLDMNSVRFCTNEMLDRFGKFQLITEYINQKRNEISEFNKTHDIDTTSLVNGRNMTNLGTFRAYIIAYLQNHPKIHNNMTFLVRYLSPAKDGMPIEIYVFSNDQDWVNYEAIQADIFDHILAVLPEFDLRVFQNPTGSDFKGLAEATKGV